MNLSMRLPFKDRELTKLKNPLGMAMEPVIPYSFNGKSSTQKSYNSRNQHLMMKIFLENKKSKKLTFCSIILCKQSMLQH